MVLDLLGLVTFLWVLWVLRETFKEGARRRRRQEIMDSWEHWE